jgi:hypothetical protein
MTEAAPTYLLTYYRPRETWQDAWIKCGDIRVEYDFGPEYGPPMMCRVLRMLGKPDGDFVVQEVGVKREFAQRWYAESIYSMSDYVSQHVLSAKLYEALCIVAADSETWTKTETTLQHALVARNYVLADELDAMVTPEGKTALAAYVAKYITKEKLAAEPVVRAPIVPRERDPNAVVSASIYSTLLTLRESPAKGPDLHGLTKRALLVSGFVVGEDNWNLTKAAHDAIARHEAVAAEVAEKVATKSEPAVRVSTSQAAAFEVVRRKPYAWTSDVPGRTRNFMVAEGWVIVKDDIPSFTDTGRKVYEANRPAV